jgi:hypothetical protein
MKNKVILYSILVLFSLLFTFKSVQAQHRPIDQLEKEDRFGLTSMFYYSYRNWTPGSQKNKGSLRFDSFRIWAQTDIKDDFFAGVQYRFYEGWNTPLYLYMGYRFDNSSLRLGQIWVPFGIDYQPFDDWGNIPFYVGLQDDYDLGITWTKPLGKFEFVAGFFKNQQLSSASSQRYDTDIYSGGIGEDDIILIQKRNEEVNQLNLRGAVNLGNDNWTINFGLSGMIGQIYNMDTDDKGQRYALAVHGIFNRGILHYNIQGTYYNYSQVLPGDPTQDEQNFINVGSWNFAYEIPVEAAMVSTSAAVDIIGNKLTAHLNYSWLTGGTSTGDSQILTAGVRSVWKSFEVFAEGYYGVNDPQLSGNASGYGRNAGTHDFRFDIRFFYNLRVLSKQNIDRLLKDR